MKYKPNFATLKIHDPISVNDEEILPFHKGLLFTKLRICEDS